MSRLRVLTVCTGNVCRSPAAAVMLRAAVEEAGLADRIEVSSAGTSWEAEGMPMDERTVRALERAGYPCSVQEHTARAVHLSDLATWDLVLPMTLEQAQTLWRIAEQIPPEHTAPRIVLWGQFDPANDVDAAEADMSVPDPWYEGQKAFDRTVLAMQRALASIVVYLRGELEQLERT